MNLPSREPNRTPSRFYESLSQLRRTEDALRLIREAEQIARAHSAKVDERAAKARWARRIP